MPTTDIYAYFLTLGKNLLRRKIDIVRKHIFNIHTYIDRLKGMKTANIGI